jgi:hypothetical protein
MKKYLIAIALMLSLGLNAEAASQKHRHGKQPTEMVDSAKKTNDAIEAFSDTTSAADADDDEDYVTYHRDFSKEDAQALKDVLDGVGGFVEPWAIVSIVAIVIMFLIAPLLIILVIFYFVNKNRRERYKLAQMAIQNGQPIPNEILNEAKNPVMNDDYQSGMRQMFIGVGLAIFLGLVIGKLGIGIGALVFFVGLGKWYVARQARMENPRSNNFNNNNDINNI